MYSCYFSFLGNKNVTVKADMQCTNNLNFSIIYYSSLLKLKISFGFLQVRSLMRFLLLKMVIENCYILKYEIVHEDLIK